MCIASSARWDTQLKGLVELERCCQDMMQEVKLLSERQEVLIGMVVSKRDMQKEAHQKYYEQIFEEMRVGTRRSQRKLCDSYRKSTF